MTPLGRHALGPIALSVGSFFALAWTALTSSSPLLVYNASNSVPAGWYRIADARLLATGDLALVRLPAEIAAFAAQRGYLPSTVPLLKTVAAIAPQHVCVQSNQVLIDGKLVARQLRWDWQGRPLPTWQVCRHLVSDELFLLSSNPESFDSRYFGPISIDAVIGLAQPLRLVTPP
ncbi:S26 family signal peptidase [Pseudomonas sp. EA_35y_Pfl2_R5]|uniref:S26 family signal peptidase n=1 Tax=Pseudomonas sp. EA_35y_Pfl2_R5 TaxID=3088690 RepID=UPI0030D81B54